MDLKIKPKQCILIGGGSSLKDGIHKYLWRKLKNNFVIGINYSYRYFPNPTILTFCDRLFYNDHREELKKLPLIIGKDHAQLKMLPNTIFLKTNDSKYYRDVRLGAWKGALTGIFSLSLGIYLLDVGQLFLLGFDNGIISNDKDSRGRKITHFYNDINHRGIGKTNYYDSIIKEKSRAYWDYLPYAKEKKVKIFNVSLKSNISTFPKISYDEFFKKMDNQTFDQNLLRQEIRKKLQ